MLSHKWDSLIDWQYCQLENCRIEDNKVILESDQPAVITSEIRDSTTRIGHYGEVIPKISVPLSTAALLYIRSGYTSEYSEDTWTDWQLINEPEQRLEYTLSLTSTKIILDYNIKSISNIYCINNSQYQRLAMNLSTMYLTPLTDADADNPIYSYLWSGAVDEAIVDFAKVDQEGEPLTIYATNATFVDNVITLSNPLPDDNVIVIIKYIPRYFIYSYPQYQYIQFKVELMASEETFFQTSDGLDFLDNDGLSFSVGYIEKVSLLVTRDGLDFMTADPENAYFNVGSINPILTSMTINYCLDFQTEMEDVFPKFFRRL